MGLYKLIFKASVEKEIRKISAPEITNILHKVESLSANPRPYGIQVLKGDNRYYRIRQGDYRIIYEINDPELIVRIIKIGHRRDVYE